MTERRKAETLEPIITSLPPAPYYQLHYGWIETPSDTVSPHTPHTPSFVLVNPPFTHKAPRTPKTPPTPRTPIAVIPSGERKSTKAVAEYKQERPTRPAATPSPPQGTKITPPPTTTPTPQPGSDLGGKLVPYTPPTKVAPPHPKIDRKVLDELAPPAPIYTCIIPKCGRLFATMEGARVHGEYCRLERRNSTKYICSNTHCHICDIPLHTRTECYMHRRECHSDIYPYQCNKAGCCYVTTIRKDLQRHMIKSAHTHATLAIREQVRTGTYDGSIAIPKAEARRVRPSRSIRISGSKKSAARRYRTRARMTPPPSSGESDSTPSIESSSKDNEMPSDAGSPGPVEMSALVQDHSVPVPNLTPHILSPPHHRRSTRFVISPRYEDNGRQNPDQEGVDDEVDDARADGTSPPYRIMIHKDYSDMLSLPPYWCEGPGYDGVEWEGDL